MAKKRGNPAIKICILCGTQTSGSVGAAGIRWSFICQPCKDREDTALLRKIEVQSKIMDCLIGRIQ